MKVVLLTAAALFRWCTEMAWQRLFGGLSSLNKQPRVILNADLNIYSQISSIYKLSPRKSIQPSAKSVTSFFLSFSFIWCFVGGQSGVHVALRLCGVCVILVCQSFK